MMAHGLGRGRDGQRLRQRAIDLVPRLSSHPRRLRPEPTATLRDAFVGQAEARPAAALAYATFLGGANYRGRHCRRRGRTQAAPT